MIHDSYLFASALHMFLLQFVADKESLAFSINNFKSRKPEILKQNKESVSHQMSRTTLSLLKLHIN